MSGATKELAIKTVKPQLPEEQKVRFLQEAAIMGQFSHPNIVKLFGVVTIGDPVRHEIRYIAHHGSNALNGANDRIVLHVYHKYLVTITCLLFYTTVYTSESGHDMHRVII